VKMITIGLGKQKGADSAHVPGFGFMGELSLKMAEIKLAKLPFLFGVASVENANHKVAHIRAFPADKIIEGDGSCWSRPRASCRNCCWRRSMFWLWISWARSFQAEAWIRTRRDAL